MNRLVDSLLGAIVASRGLPRCSSKVGRRGRRRRRSRLDVQALEPRLALSGSGAPIDMIMTPVGNRGNAADAASGFGRVNVDYQIGKYEVTIGQYTAFLNAVAADGDPHGLYNPAMGGDKTSAGITQASTADGFNYSVSGPSGAAPAGAASGPERPIANVSWFDAARFANWMANGQPTGGEESATTENGAYDLTRGADGDVVPRNAINPNTGEAPSYFLPSEDEWYKAAYYSPNLRHGSGGYYRYATQSDEAPGNVIGDGADRANYILDATGNMSVTQLPYIDPNQNYLSNVGAFAGSPSYYGTFDQTGNVWEWMDAGGASGTAAILRGGAWTSFASFLESTYRLSVDAETTGSNGGFRLAGLPASSSPLSIAMVPVGDAGNAADPSTNLGAVSYDYSIAKYDVTIGQYTAFLNAVARRDPHGLYNKEMGADLNIAGIARSGRPGVYAYSVINNDGDSADRPVSYVSWFDAARFANWMANGQPCGHENRRTTENGAYNLGRSGNGRAVARNTINPNTGEAPTFFIPTEDEWYKAAYYSPDHDGAGGAGYFTYATQSDETPGNAAGGGSNLANYLGGNKYSVTQVSTFDPGQNYLTDVGSFPASVSFYGTLDQGGDVYQWNDLDGTPGRSRGLRGGFWAGGAITLQKSTSSLVAPTREANDAGFRLVSVERT